MTDSNRSNSGSTDVQALFEERRKYDAWLTALDARRESTPQHVFDRVRADYEARLQQVDERLSAHRHAITEERASLVSRRSLLEAEDQLRRDERAELELRAHVGELAGKDSEAAFKAVDESLEEMRGEREKLDKRIAELDRLLENRAAAEATSEAEPEPEPEPSIAAEVPEPPREEKSVPQTPGGSFDELAFLSDVVGKEDAKPAVVVDDEPSSLLDGLTPRGRDDAPLASGIPSNTPIVLRSSGAIEQVKTLKCNECGAMNYPTEWYCERCGAELAAL
jgi:hypothetical protein